MNRSKLAILILALFLCSGATPALAITVDDALKAYDQLLTEILRELPVSRGEEILEGLSQSGAHFSLPSGENQTQVTVP